jgi:integral membrane protein
LLISDLKKAMKLPTILKTTIGRLRVAGIMEGISCIALFGVAMPVKYLGEIPAAVKIPGWIHGLLFMLYLLALLHVTIAKKWSVKKVAVAFIASLIPCGTFFLDSRLKKEESGIPDIDEAINNEAINRI